MTTTKADRGTAAITREMEQKRTRRAALEQRLTETKGELDRLRAEQGRALADGLDGPKPSAISALTETRDGLNRALGVLDADLAQLESDLRDSRVAAAEASARSEEKAAIAIGEELRTLLKSLITSKVLPLEERFREALHRARAAQKAADSAAGVQRESFHRSSVEQLVYEPNAKTIRLVSILNDYVDGKPLPVAAAGTAKPANFAMS